MIIQHLKQFTDYSKKDWERHLSQSDLFSDFLRQEIAEKKILIQSAKLYDSYWLISYKTTKESAFVEGFSNIGQPYYWEEPEWLQNCFSTQQFKNESGLYYCMVLPGHLQRAGVHIKFSDDIQTNVTPLSHLNLNISFFGPLIGIRSGSTNLDGSSVWSDIQIHLSCGKKDFKYNVPRVGHYWKKIKKIPSLQGQGFTAPLRFRIPVRGYTKSLDQFSASSVSDCKEQDIKEIELTFTHLHEKLYTSQPPEKIKVVWKK